MSIYIHESSFVSDNVKLGNGAKIWHFSHIRENVEIGENVSIGQNVYIDKNVKIGDNCKIQNNVSIYDGVTIGNNVFIGPGVMFTNDLYPKVEGWSEDRILKTYISNNVSIGANSTIICGVTIGEGSLIGAATNVTKSFDGNLLIYGNPASVKKKLK